MALDLLEIDISDADELAAFVARHALAPARRAHGLPEPAIDEGDDFLFEPAEPLPGGGRIRQMRPAVLEHPAAHFDPLIRGLLLFGHLFPPVWYSHQPEQLIAHPGVQFTGAALTLALRPYDEVIALARAALGLPTAPPLFHGTAGSNLMRNESALAELHAAQALVRRALGDLDDFGDYRRINVGLQAMDPIVAGEIDEILRAEVRQRLVWLANFEEADLANAASSLWITFDEGVFGAQVPETLRALVLLDLVESFKLGTRVGACGRCGQPVVMSAQRAARHARGEAIYHDRCGKLHRLAYFREYHAARRAHTAEPPTP
jgi:hypothetical protein